MERSREARRANMAAANGLTRRRQRSTSLRESHVVEEDSQMVLQDTVRLRDRARKRDRDRERDREFSNHHHKRRRGDSLTVGEEERTEESVAADEQDFVTEERRVAHANSHNSTSLSSSSLSNQNSRKSLPPARLPVKQAPALKAVDELIGALVPRKARSASVKRSHESWLSGNGGFWEDQKASSTSAASRSAEANSPSSSNVSIKKKMKPNGPKTRLPMVVKCSSPSVQQDDIEIEIAEVLFGLMKQSRNSNKEDDSNTIKLVSKDVVGISQNTKSSVTFLPQNTIPAADLLLVGAAQKKKKVEADNSSNLFPNDSGSSSIKIDCEMETSAPKSEQTATHEVDALKAASMAMERQEGLTKQGDSKLSIQGSGGPDGSVTEKKSISAKEESVTCLKTDVDSPNSTVTKASSIILENGSRKEEKFKIDLMAPPPMVSSPEREGFNDIAPVRSFEANDVKMKSLVKDEEKTDRFLEEELVEQEAEENKIPAIGEKRQVKIDSETPNQDNGRDGSITLQQTRQKQQQLHSKSTIAKVQKTGAESSSSPLKISVAGWPNGPQPLGTYVPPFQTMTPMDGITRSSTAQQHYPFMLSQPQPKRCATHCCIARNIYLHQQLEKMNPFWSAGAGSDLLHGAKPNNPKAMLSTENIIHGTPLQGRFPILNQHSGQDKGQAVVSFPHPAHKDKISEGVNLMDPAPNKQLGLQQAPQLPPVGNLLHAPAFIFPVSQQQAAVTAAANQPGTSKSAVTSTKSASVYGNSTAATPPTTVALPPAAAATVSYNFPNLAGNETPYLTILQNNGYPFPVPTPIGTAPAIRGVTHAQALPFFNGSFYSSQIFHPPQLHQQQPHSQSIMQAAHQNTSTSSASSSSHKQLHHHQPRGVSVSGNNFVSSISMQSQQTQKQHVSSTSNQNHKLEAEMGGENAPSVADSRLSHHQTCLYGQNFSVPLQPLNFQLMPSSAFGGSTGGAHNEKQQQSQQKSSKGGVELIPQTLAMSFGSFSGSNSPSNLNFSALQHNPAIFQSLPDIARYQIVPAAQAAPQKNHQITEMKTGGSSKHDEGKMPGSGKSSATNVQTLVFDNSARTLNFVSSPSTGNWPSRSTTSTAITTNVPIAANSQNFQQQQLLQLQKQQILQQQQQSTAATRSKAQTSNCLPSSPIGAKFSNKAPTFSQTLVQSNSSCQSPQWKNSARNQTNQVPPASLTSCGTKNVSQQQARSSQGHIQISFERHSKSGLPPQGQHNQSPTGSKAGSSIPTLQSQQADNSSASTGQKSSPVCGRNLPSILSTCPSHLSELKY